MKVLLRTNIIIDGTRYRASLEGTELPDFTKDGRKIVLHKEPRPKATRDEDGNRVLPKEYMLPKGIVLYTSEGEIEAKKKKLPLNAKVNRPAETLSEMTRNSPTKVEL